MRRRHQLLIGEMNNIEIMNMDTAEPQERIASLDEDGEAGTTAPGPKIPKVVIQDAFSNTEC